MPVDAARACRENQSDGWKTKVKSRKKINGSPPSENVKIVVHALARVAEGGVHFREERYRCGVPSVRTALVLGERLRSLQIDLEEAPSTGSSCETRRSRSLPPGPLICNPCPATLSRATIYNSILRGRSSRVRPARKEASTNRRRRGEDPLREDAPLRR